MDESKRDINLKRIFSKSNILTLVLACMAIGGVISTVFVSNTTLGIQDLCIDIFEAETWDGADNPRNTFQYNEPINVWILAENKCGLYKEKIIITAQFISPSRTTVPNLSIITLDIEPDERFGAVLSANRLMEPSGNWTIQINAFDGKVSQGGEPLSAPTVLTVFLEPSG